MPKQSCPSSSQWVQRTELPSRGRERRESVVRRELEEEGTLGLKFEEKLELHVWCWKEG